MRPTENFFKKVFTSKLLTTHYLLQEATAKFIMSKKCFFNRIDTNLFKQEGFFWKSKKCSDYLTPTSGSKGVTEAVKKKTWITISTASYLWMVRITSEF